LDPRQARRFAQATGKLAKTDRGDALMLARMGTALDLEPRAPAGKTVEAMKELVNARDALVKDRVAALNRQATAVSPLIRRQLAQRLRQING
jgi:transposase